MSFKTLRSHARLATGLLIPVVLFYAAHFVNAPDGKRPTGFVQYDIPYYMANARQYFDGQSKGIFYSNAYDYRTDAPAIYFQPQIALLSIPLRAIPGRPALPFLVLGAVSAFLALLLISILVDRLCPDLDRKTHALLTLITCWGGGILVWMGIAIEALRGWSGQFLRFDPDRGWWLINFGRNMLIPTEAMYHMLAAGIWVAIAFGRVRAAIAIAFLLAMAHPFTGVQYGLILLTWLAAERVIFNSGNVRTSDVVLGLLPVTYSFGYYVFYLGMFPQHRELLEQWTVFEWYLAPISLMGGFASVAALALLRCRSVDRCRACFADPANRLLAISFLVSLALSKHELLIKPHQPIHFVRGHIWAPLCLLGLPVLAGWIAWLRRRGRVGGVAIVAGIAMILSDNIKFLIENSVKPTGVYIAGPVRETFAYLQRSGDRSILVSDEYDAVGYLSAVYSGIRPYMGHYANTLRPTEKMAAIERFFADGTLPPDLAGERFMVVTSRHRQRMDDDTRFEPVFSSGDYGTYRLGGTSTARGEGVSNGEPDDTGHAKGK